MLLKHTAQGNREIMHVSATGHLSRKTTLPNGSQKQKAKIQTPNGRIEEFPKELNEMKAINPPDTELKKKND